MSDHEDLVALERAGLPTGELIARAQAHLDTLHRAHPHLRPVPEPGSDAFYDLQDDHDHGGVQRDRHRDRGRGTDGDRRDQPAAAGHGAGQHAQAPAPPGRLLQVRSIAQVLAELDAAPHRSWLIQQLWPADAYGVLGAQDKAGKTWTLLDLAVSVAAGLPWLGHWPCPAPGPVTLFLGEGGMPGMIRRLRAICAHKGTDLAELPLRLEFKVPNLTRDDHLNLIAAELAAHPARLVGIDPYYLAAGGRTGTNLYEMGEVLAGIQAVCQDAAAALVLLVHWNKTGEGRGAQRFSGVGPSAWGRVLGSGSVEQSHTNPQGHTSVTICWQFTGGEIPDAQFRMQRRVWADDPADLNSPLHYQVEVTQQAATTAHTAPDGLSVTKQRILNALEAGGTGQSVRTIGDRIATDDRGPALTAKTIINKLGELQHAGLVEGTDEGPGRPRRWSPVARPPTAADPTREQPSTRTFPDLP